MTLKFGNMMIPVMQSQTFGKTVVGSNLKGRLDYVPIQSETLEDVIRGKNLQKLVYMNIIDYFQQDINGKEEPRIILTILQAEIKVNTES